jgi:hypothetical protein
MAFHSFYDYSDKPSVLPCRRDTGRPPSGRLARAAITEE